MVDKKKPFLLICIALLFSIYSCSDNDSVEKGSLMPAKFELPFNNTSAQRGQVIRVEVDVATDLKNIKNIKVYTSDTVIFEGLPTETKNFFEVPTTNWKIGTNQISLATTTQDGKTKKDHRIVTILPSIFPTVYTTKVLNVYPHNTTSYTQGLEFNEGQLYESTGGRGSGSVGKSMIAKVDLKTGEIQKKKELKEGWFGEGITVIKNQLFQLTWQKHTCYVYDKNSFKKLKTFTYTGEGWGLTNNGKEIIMSNGSNRIYFRSPKDFSINRVIEVYTNEGPVPLLNELEYIDGKIYANVYTQNFIVIIDPATGVVTGRIDASFLVLDYRKDGDVLNGIAYRPETKQLYVTGKDWSSMLEIELKKQ